MSAIEAIIDDAGMIDKGDEDRNEQMEFHAQEYATRYVFEGAHMNVATETHKDAI